MSELTVTNDHNGGNKSRAELMAEYKEGVLKGLFNAEMCMDAVQCDDLTEPGRMFMNAGVQLQSVLDLMRQANEEQDDSTSAVNEMLKHMSAVSPKKTRDEIEDDQNVAVPTAREKITHVERILQAGEEAKAIALLRQIVEMHDAEEQALAPMLQDQPSTIQETAEANHVLGNIASAHGRAANAEKFYGDALELFKQCDESDERRAHIIDTTAQLMFSMLEQEESLNEDGEISHSREDHEELLSGLVLDSALLIMDLPQHCESGLVLIERSARAQASLGKWKAASSLCEDAVEAASVVYEQQPHKVAEIMSRCAALLTSDPINYPQAMTEEIFSQALKLSEDAMELVKQAASPENEVGTLLQCCSVGGIYVEQKKYSEAKAILAEAIPILGKILGPTHVSLAYVVRDYAEACLALGFILDAKNLFKQAHMAMQQNRDCFGEDDILRCYNGTQLHIAL